jgi:hypothetical protein
MKDIKNSNQKKELDDIDNIKKLLIGLGFFCTSHPSSHLQIYSKNKDKVIISNNKKKVINKIKEK